MNPWLFNIHRHNIMREVGVDAYVLSCIGHGRFKHPINLLFMAPADAACIRVSERSLMTIHSVNFCAFNYFAKTGDLKNAKALMQTFAALSKASDRAMEEEA